MEQQSPNKNESSIEFSPTRVDAGDQKRRRLVKCKRKINTKKTEN